MGKPGAFLEHGRVEHELRPVSGRVCDCDALYIEQPVGQTRVQASRCMQCGVAFCQVGHPFGRAKTSGCPLHNLIPEWNDLAYRGLWEDAAERLALTSPMPEFTSRVCPALCEAACNLGNNDEPVTIHDNERAISDWQWSHGGPRCFDGPRPDAPSVCVVGSGPAGLVAAWELARRGARVCVVERADRAGGLLMYGIPNMKLPKGVVDRRVRLMERLGIEFRLGVDASDAKAAAALADEFDAVVLAVGACAARGMAAEGFDAALDCGGAVYAVEYLTEATRALLEGREPAISAEGLDVVVVGSGDTGNDCMGVAVRQGARTVRQLAHGPRPPRPEDVPKCWPEWPNVLKTDYGQEEAAAMQGEDLREWSAESREFLFDEGGAVRGLRVESVVRRDGVDEPVEGTSREVPAQLVLVACGFAGPERDVLDAFGVRVTEGARPRPVCEDGGHYAACVRGGERVVCQGKEACAVPARGPAVARGAATPVYVAGDARLGSTLVVTAMADALACAEEVAERLRLG